MAITIAGSGTITGISAGGLPDDSIIAADIAAGAVAPAKLSTGGPSWTSGGDLSFNSGYGSAAVAYGCRAWVNLNISSGASSIRASGNISSVTFNATGKVTLNFTSAMPDANYILTTSSGTTGSTSTTGFAGVGLSSSTSYNNKTTSACDVWILAGNNAAFLNQFDINVAIFR